MNRLELKKLLAFIFDGEVSQDSANQMYDDLLHAYINAELDGQDAAAKFPALKAYMDGCPACQEEYEEMKELLLMQRRGLLRTPPVEAEFDFSFLSKVAPSPSIWQVVERAGKQVRQLFTVVRIALSQSQAAFEQLPNPLVAQWQVVPMRSSDENERVPLLSLSSPENDLAFRLIITNPAEKETTLTSEVTRISSQEPVERARVTLRDAKYRMLESNLTRSEGRVTFGHMQAGSYVVEVKFQGQSWEIPLSITGQG